MHDTDSVPRLSGVFLPSRPLLGLTVLVVEDSLYACDAIRLLCLRSGARIRRADCLKSARRHLLVYRPAVIVVDIGLPDGNGLDLIKELSATRPRIATILASSGDDSLADSAIAAGADGFLAKPVNSLASFQHQILSHLPEDMRPDRARPRPMIDEVVTPDPIAFQDDLTHMADVLDSPEAEDMLDYVAQFLTGVARSANDMKLADAAADLARVRADGKPFAAQAAAVTDLVRERLTKVTRAV
ncbi:response regulator [Chachezhania sediminis]|uniref:response regulator n=1 Tax=Chachezhania sediminis TaxID=2599291 RepID=UPI00131D5478|nr:response regulator [Chachezhania sediminis]